MPINSLWPIDALCCRRTRPALVHVMAWCLTWTNADLSSTWKYSTHLMQDFNHETVLENYSLNITAPSTNGHSVKFHYEKITVFHGIYFAHVLQGWSNNSSVHDPMQFVLTACDMNSVVFHFPLLCKYWRHSHVSFELWTFQLIYMKR